MKKTYAAPTVVTSGSVASETKGPPVATLDSGNGIGAATGSVGFNL